MRTLSVRGAIGASTNSRDFNREIKSLVGISSIGIKSMFKQLTRKDTSPYAMAVRKVEFMLCS